MPPVADKHAFRNLGHLPTVTSRVVLHWLACSEQLAHRFAAAGKQVQHAAAYIGISGIDRHSEVAINRGGEVARRDRSILNLAAFLVGTANHLGVLRSDIMYRWTKS